LAKVLVSAAAGVIVGVPVMLSFSRESIVDTEIATVSSPMAVSVELVMPIPAAMKPPSPPAMVKLLGVENISMLRVVEELMPPPEPSIWGDFHRVVLLLVVLMSAELGVATRHRTRNQKHADTEDMSIIETRILNSRKSVALPRFPFAWAWSKYTASQAMAGENTQSDAVGVQLRDHAVTPLLWDRCAW
jgi:hypothetical protein